MSNSFSALNEEEDDDEEDVENVYDESANLIQNTKAGGSSSFTAAAELEEIRPLIRLQSDTLQAALQADLKVTKGLIQAGRNGDGGETAPPIPRSMKLDGNAAEWFWWMTRNKLITTWDGFLESVQNRFGPCKYEDPQGALLKLLQKGLLISFYISGLKPAIQRELLVSKPTSLGDAFSLAHVTEARLEDQGVLVLSTYGERLVKSSKPFKVYIGIGEMLLCEIICSRITLSMQGLIMEVDLYVLPMKGPDVVLGIQWLQKLGKVTHDCAQQTMEFSLANTTYSLKGYEFLRMKQISLHHMQALLKADDVYGVYEVHSFSMVAKGITTSSEMSESMSPEIEQLLVRFSSLFQVPTTLPPHRTIDHINHLLPNTKPVNVRPYSYPHYQKGKMEKLVKEMMEQGFIRFSQSSFLSPVLLVKKKDGSYRFCVDYRALNEVTIKDKFPIPTADEMFDELGGADIFTKLDLHAGKGVKMNPKKVMAVMEWPVPKTQRQICGFLGLTGYYRRFIKNFAIVAVPLSQAPILVLPNFEDMFIVEADASNVGISAVLMQNGKPLSYFSRKLGPLMRLAATYQKELFAVVEAVYKWRQYLLGRCFTIRTDHMSLKELMQQVIQTPLQQKYVQKLMGFDFAIEYKTGTTNVVAYAFSRVYDEADEVIASFMALSQPLVSLVDDLRKENETLDELKIIH
ncbi:retrotransposon-related protein [Tanacetum coccineum]|uniref:RNA-directed DNA polymerase n=1 Tax=Tanacetum coccineum TaxID=301880 RepID=A0ABQ5AJF6_9ASTR